MRRPLAFRPWLALTDALLLAAAVPAAHGVRTRLLAPVLAREIQPLAEYLAPGAVVAALGLVSLGLARLHEDRRYLSRLLEYATVAKALTYAMLAATALTFLLKAFQYSRGLLVAYWAVATGLVVAGRSAWHQIEKALRRAGYDTLPVAVLAAGRASGRLVAMLRRYPELGYRPVARVAPAARPGPGLTRLEALTSRGAIRGVLVEAEDRDYQRVLPYLAWCEERGVPHHRLTGAFDAMHGGAEPGDLPAVEPRPIYAAAKRGFDEVVAVALLILTAPLWAVIALAIKAGSPGPVFFTQDRVGRHGRLFRVVKFRSMHVHAPAYARKARRIDDPRVTGAGRWLRRTSLDELPQLLNVIRGEMSLVGPRPEMPFMVARNTLAYRRRLMVLPGVTGLWQAVARHVPLEEGLKYDLYYLRHRSFAFDLVILARTALSLLTGRGAT